MRRRWVTVDKAVELELLKPLFYCQNGPMIVLFHATWNELEFNSEDDQNFNLASSVNCSWLPGDDLLPNERLPRNLTIATIRSRSFHSMVYAYFNSR